MTKMKHARLIVALLLALIVGSQARAQTSTPGKVLVENAWARATPGGAKTGAAYMTLVNAGAAADRLLGATTSVADKVQFHKDEEENGVSRMRQLQTVELAPGATIVFKPAVMHIMLVGLKQPLKEGQTFPLALEFEKAGKVEVTVSVAKIGAMEPGGAHPAAHGTDRMHK